MGQVTLSVGGYSYGMACKDGEEGHMLRLGELLDQQVKQLVSAIGTASETRQLLMAGLVLADRLQERETQAPIATPPIFDLQALESLALQLEGLASRLENARASA